MLVVLGVLGARVHVLLLSVRGLAMGESFSAVAAPVVLNVVLLVIPHLKQIRFAAAVGAGILVFIALITKE